MLSLGGKVCGQGVPLWPLPGSLKLDHALPEAPCIVLEDDCIFRVQVEPVT